MFCLFLKGMGSSDQQVPDSDSKMNASMLCHSGAGSSAAAAAAAAPAEFLELKLVYASNAAAGW
jgi:hypothetical protein